jgi:prepilin-type N-terminal cleavage/methylation domain-containing protein
MKPHKSRQAGYSLAEMLTVVAIIGTLALVTVPSFMNYYNSNKVKSSMRAFMSDLRTARMLAISRGREVKFSYQTGAKSRTYNYYEGNRSMGVVTQWTPLTGPGSNPPRPQKTLEDVAYFPLDAPDAPQTFVDEDTIPDGFIDVIFFPDGHVRIPVNDATQRGAVGTITIKTDRKVPKKQYAIEISPTGRVIAK